MFARKANYPLLYTIGDSISIGWLPHLTRRIVEQASRLNSAQYTVAHSPGTGHSARLRESAEAWLVGLRPSVVVFNCGLHDLGRTAESDWERAVEPDAYRQNLLGVAEVLKALRPRARLIWLHTTPIDEGRMHASGGYTNYRRKAEDVDMYNAIAQWVMEECEIEVVDVNAAVRERGTQQLLGPDGVHFTDEGYAVLGDVIAWRVIGEYLRTAEVAGPEAETNTVAATAPEAAPGAATATAPTAAVPHVEGADQQPAHPQPSPSARTAPPPLAQPQTQQTEVTGHGS